MSVDVHTIDTAFDRLMTDVAGQMVGLRFNRGVAFMSLPLIYPDGSFVTVSVRKGDNGYTVSDNGFAYRELEAIGRGRSFSQVAKRLGEDDDLTVGRRTITVSTKAETLERAICDVAGASYRTVCHIYDVADEEDEETVEEEVRDRLETIFHEAVIFDDKIVGASTSQWKVTGMVKNRDEGVLTVFQAVANYAQSVYKANALFDDLLALDNPPNVVSVVKSKKDLGPKFNILNRAGRIIEIGDTAEHFRRLTA